MKVVIVMYNNGFLKVQASTPKIVAGDLKNNALEILNTLNASKAGLLVFPELAITGHSIGDLFFNEKLLKEARESLSYILKNNQYKGLAAIGMPLLINGVIFNVAVVISHNEILGVVPKFYLPNHLSENEKRYFYEGRKANFNKIELFGKEVPFGKILFKEKDKDITVGIEVCQDMWVLDAPSNDLAKAGANVILNLSASSEVVGKEYIRRNTVLNHSRTQVGAYVYTTTGIYESSSEFLYSSHKIISVLGKLVKESELINFESNELISDININLINYERRIDSNYRDSIFNNNYEYETVHFELEENNSFEFNDAINLKPFVPNDYELDKIFDILTYSLVKKILSVPISSRKIVLGLSGGLDSSFALLVAHNAFKMLNLDLKNLIVVAMPALVSKSESFNDALELTNKLGIELKEVNISKMVDQHLSDINHEKIDVTYENTQARIRTLVLMNLANKHGGFVLGTGDMSEIALGFMTYNGDQMSMYAINQGLPKTTMQSLTLLLANNKYNIVKDVLEKIVNKKISPELLEGQATEDIIGSYLINDFIMYYHLVEGLEEDKLKWLVNKAFNLSVKESDEYVSRFIKLFYNSQFKRATLPEGPKVFNVSLSPRNSFKMPSDVLRK